MNEVKKNLPEWCHPVPQTTIIGFSSMYMCAFKLQYVCHSSITIEVKYLVNCYGEMKVLQGTGNKIYCYWDSNEEI